MFDVKVMAVNGEMPKGGHVPGVGWWVTSYTGVLTIDWYSCRDKYRSDSGESLDPDCIVARHGVSVCDECQPAQCSLLTSRLIHHTQKDYITYTMSLPVEHTPHTTCLHPAPSSAPPPSSSNRIWNPPSTFLFQISYSAR